VSLKENGPAPYTTVTALTGVIDWYRDKAPTGPITADAIIRAGVPESLGRRTIHSLVLVDLIGKDGQPTAQFEDFRKIRGEDEYRSRLQEWVRGIYAEVLQFCDPSTDTLDRIIEAFRGYEPQGQRRAMASLFLGLWRYAGLPGVSSQGTPKERATPRSPRPKPLTGSVGARSSARSTLTARGRAIAKEHSGGSSTDGLPPGLVGLLHQIPRDGGRWTQATRDNFLNAFTAVLDFSVPIGDPAAPDDGLSEEGDEEV
jgi:hypothetical protein